MDRAPGKAAEEPKPKWDHSKNWKNIGHLGVKFDRKGHQKFREETGNAAFQLVRRLTPRKNRGLTTAANPNVWSRTTSAPRKRGESYAAEWNRFVAGAWRGSSRERIADIVGIAELKEAMTRKRIIWAASV